MHKRIDVDGACIRCGGVECMPEAGLTCTICVEAIRDGSEPNGADRRPLSTPPAAPVTVPDGWQLVPKEPSDKMMLVGGFSFAGKVPNDQVFPEVRKIWDKMLSASPAPSPGGRS